MCARVIDEDAAHHFRGDSKKVRSVLPRDTVLAGEPQVGLVDECGWLKGVIDPFAPKVSSSPPPEVFVHQGHQLVACPDVTVRPCAQQTADRVSARHDADGPPLSRSMLKGADSTSAVRWARPRRSRFGSRGGLEYEGVSKEFSCRDRWLRSHREHVGADR